MTLLEWLQMIGLRKGVYIWEPVHDTVISLQRAAILRAKDFCSVHFKHPDRGLLGAPSILQRQALPPFKH